MSDEWLNSTRELLALRDRATPGPWRCFGKDHEMRVIGGADGYTLFRLEAGGRAAMELAAAAHDMADTIAALLVEVERLTTRLRALCEQEPVAWQSQAHPRLFLPHEGTSPEHWMPLIPRPSMED